MSDLLLTNFYNGTINVPGKIESVFRYVLCKRYFKTKGKTIFNFSSFKL